ncbi:transmembrane transcriptional regulator [Sulfuricella denitrificans skB26]|uniref:Transmembrane transcriptional regulator n=1 Tax=Sulfuricella denitrificans (strain DSM 22764 / NBRC 105220 / skB26) TaxID=1163617 RepID=S6AHN1_SULDS|nr:anti-sigma factor [Sulfuricella denitrificans]BAN34034.1 transmembrane transcriptional regulator [Sulfuricella denitrificans skB26]
MSEQMQTVNEDELQAYADGQLDEKRCAEVAAWLASHPVEAGRVEDCRRQNEALHALFDPVLDEPVPPRLQRPAPASWHGMSLLRHAAVVAWLTIGGTIGWFLHGTQDVHSGTTMAFVRQAAVAHVVYTPEVRHPVEVGAEQEAHLVAWLSKRLGVSVKAPHLSEAGYELVGGRLLPGSSGPAAQFMYQDGRGQRLTLYVRTDGGDSRETAFRYARENNIGVFYWIDGPLGYALSGDLEKTELLKVAQAVYHQLNP